MADSQPEIFARHYAEAGLVEKSVEYWGRAAHRSSIRSGMVEAAAQLQKGLDQLALLPDGPDRHRKELEFCGALGAVLLAVKGQAAPETGHAFARAQGLWEQLGSPSEFLEIPYGQSRYHAVRGELDLARRLDENLLESEPSPQRLCRVSSGSHVLRSKPDVCGQVCFGAIASGSGACAS